MTVPDRTQIVDTQNKRKKKTNKYPEKHFLYLQMFI